MKYRSLSSITDEEFLNLFRIRIDKNKLVHAIKDLNLNSVDTATLFIRVNDADFIPDKPNKPARITLGLAILLIIAATICLIAITLSSSTSDVSESIVADQSQEFEGPLIDMSQVDGYSQPDIKPESGQCTPSTATDKTSITMTYSDSQVVAVMTFQYLNTSNHLGGTLYENGLDGEENDFVVQNPVWTRLNIYAQGNTATLSCLSPGTYDSRVTLTITEGGIYRLFKGGKYSYYQIAKGQVYRLQNEVGILYDPNPPAQELLLNYPLFTDMSKFSQ